MELLTGSTGLFEAIGRLRAAAPDALTNFFVTPKQAAAWMERGTLSIRERDGSVLVLRRDRGVHRVYHAAVDFGELSRALASLTAGWRGVLTADLVGRPEETARVAEIYRLHGFEHYTSLVRMVRLTDGPSSDALDSTVVFAARHDVPTLCDFFDRVLDPLRDQVPEAEEIEAAVARTNILIERHGEDVGGALYFETTGLTSMLRYWYVDPRFHGLGIGGRLMRKYIELCRGTRRIVLWVVSGNADAIAKYRHYGFREDNLIDRIVVFRGKP
jgi:GNAT superfamily N-acetyltransferase